MYLSDQRNFSFGQGRLKPGRSQEILNTDVCGNRVSTSLVTIGFSAGTVCSVERELLECSGERSKTTEKVSSREHYLACSG